MQGELESVQGVRPEQAGVPYLITAGAHRHSPTHGACVLGRREARWLMASRWPQKSPITPER
jgi:hypothetical protein